MTLRKINYENVDLLHGIIILPGGFQLLNDKLSPPKKKITRMREKVKKKEKKQKENFSKFDSALKEKFRSSCGAFSNAMC